ncbi:MAG: hypothetical protein RIS25_101 [Actinomycetota bacterium]|jgi:sortase A
MRAVRGGAQRRGVSLALDILQDVAFTVGGLILLFLVWHTWFNDIVAGSAQNQASHQLAEQWSAPAPSATPTEPSGTPTPRPSVDPTQIPVLGSHSDGEAFATLIVPRFGTEYERVIAEGIDPETVLNSSATGVGHYPQSAALGEIGNFAVAAHRTTFGAPFAEIEKLRIGDHIYIETPDGWYVYSYRNTAYVWPADVNVLNPVPTTNLEAGQRLLTMTSCHPELSSAERIIAYSVFDYFAPRELGIPAEIQHLREGNA